VTTASGRDASQAPETPECQVTVPSRSPIQFIARARQAHRIPRPVRRRRLGDASFPTWRVYLAVGRAI